MHTRFRLPAIAAGLALAAMSPAYAQVSFLDHRGVKIELEKPAERVVTTHTSGAIAYLAVDGSADHIAAMAVRGKDALTSAVYDEIFPRLADIPASAVTEGFVPNVEAILALNPDLVMQWTSDPKLIEPLERVGLKVMGWDCCTEQQRRDYLLMAGYTSGKIDRAQSMLAMQDASNAALRERFAATPATDYVKILEVDQLADQIRVVANSSQDYALSGVANLAADGTEEWWRTIDVEQFLVWNPSVIIIPAWATDLTPQSFYDNALLASVDAIKNKRVYKVPAFNRSPDAPEVYLTAVWLAAITHPDAAAGSFRDVVAAGYKAIYSADLTAAQIDKLLELEANTPSEGYTAQFGG
jgi:iron complex transport system substrate-binding protein